ncbi:MAG: hypothetical protein ACD_40C00213G0029 [uncultured bacterium]|nr:MAG: hypothetical protein ACD_40C00213G0029 [uncultured bacterium]
MLKTRIIPTILWKNENIVKGIGFDSWRRIGTLLPAVKVYNLRQVDELIILDIQATEEGRLPNLGTISDITKECFVPLTIGGGIRTASDVKDILRVGADKICLNTTSYTNPSIVSDIAYMYGSQCVVASIDAKLVGSEYYCYSHNGTVNTGRTVRNWAKELEKLGAGEIIITSIEKDGTMQGYDLDLISLVSTTVKIPVIASGGAGKYEDMYQAIVKGNASAVAASNMFNFTEATPHAAREYLRSKHIPVRKI